MRHRKLRRAVRAALVWLGFIIIGIFSLGPIIWGIRTSVAPAHEAALIPSRFTLEHYAALFQRPEITQYLVNSLIVSSGAILVVVPIATLAAYALARLHFKGRQYGVLLLIMPMLPAIALLVPLIAYTNRLGIYNTYLAVILANAVFTVPFATWMLKDFIRSNPASIEESALIDGCSRIQMLIRISFPMMAPGLAAVIVFVFVMSWNNYVYAFALTASPRYRVLPQGILAFLGAWGTNWGGLTASGTIALIPPVVFFLFFRKRFVAGLFGHQLK